jgi:hypothetical protein
MKKKQCRFETSEWVLKNPPNKDREEEDVKAEVGV